MSNHPNRGSKGPSSNPSPEDVKALRERVQAAKKIGITAAQDWCAEQVHTTRRVWQQWESGDRRMHPAFWELTRIKSALIAQSPERTAGQENEDDEARN